MEVNGSLLAFCDSTCIVNIKKHNVYYTGAVTEGQQTSINFHTPMLHRHKNHCIIEESTNTVKYNNFQYPHHIIISCNFNILYN